MAKWIVLFFVTLISIGSSAHAGNGFSFTFQKNDGNPLKLNEFEGKALLVVNTATECNFSYQFEHLEQVWRDRKDEGLVVVGVASNDFGGQEPRSGKTLSNYCTRKYGITFPLTDRTPVIGADAHPFYKWAATEAGSAPRWNFHKYIVGRDGEVVASFPSSVDPHSAQMALAITAALKRPAK